MYLDSRLPDYLVHHAMRHEFPGCDMDEWFWYITWRRRYAAGQ